MFTIHAARIQPEVRMPKKKLPWRTLVMSDEDQVGRFNRDEVRQIFLELKALREAEAAQARSARRKEARRKAKQE